MKRGELAAISLMDPWITLAEKEGLQKIIETHYVGTEIASEDVDAASWEAANRALRDAVVLINADKRKYVHYLIDALPDQYAKLIAAEISISRACVMSIPSRIRARTSIRRTIGSSVGA